MLDIPAGHTIVRDFAARTDFWWRCRGCGVRDTVCRIRTAGLCPDDHRSERLALGMLDEVLRQYDIHQNDLYAIAKFLARTKSRLMVISLEDLLGVIDQPNIPGTVNEHPNWRQRLPVLVPRR